MSFFQKKSDKKQNINLTSNAAENKQVIYQALGESADITSRTISVDKQNQISMVLLYINGLVDQKIIQNMVLETLMIEMDEQTKQEVAQTPKDIQSIYQEFSLIAEELQTIEELILAILNGDTVFFIDGKTSGFSIKTQGDQTSRGVQQTTTQQVVRGPKDSFTESIDTNVALVRKRIKDPNLWSKKKVIGSKTHTTVVYAYLNGVVSSDLVTEVEERLSKIEVNSILESGNIEEFIQDETYTPFPTVYNTERPDAIAAGILEGRIAIFVDGTPDVLLVPVLFKHFLQSPEDYYQRSDIATLLRWLRTLALFLSLLTPSIYIALTTFHQEMIPTTLLISLAAQREGIPFPAFGEAVLMEITFELLREAGIRLPTTIGSAISIVGALVLGQATVEAGIVSAMMVIVVSLTAISSFVFPSYNFGISIRILRFGFMTLAATFGLFGIFIGLLLIVMHLVGLRSFGMPYLTPIAPFNKEAQTDTLLRLPIWKKTKQKKPN
ncbi:spore germination protein [Paraliobacillus salinarum]|uniref:spore germination protein n=1 Tax=Paraliobacillus salinarum TaxID=1158996 RepID=UPI001FE3FB0B|nr:spore germination protein [Paraliobacillus salinarum]